MPTVNTVLGPVETANLGFTLSHEHVGTNAAGLRHTYPEFIDRAGLLEQAIAAMREAYQEGVRTMVEVSTFDLGRDIELIQEGSRDPSTYATLAALQESDQHLLLDETRPAIMSWETSSLNGATFNVTVRSPSAI